jgi:dienelactone hydrolase
LAYLTDQTYPTHLTKGNMHSMRHLRWLAVVVALVGLALIVRPYATGLAFVVRAADMHGAMRRIADLGAGSVSDREISIPARTGAIRARLYLPGQSPRRLVLLVSGLHAAGIEEPRLAMLARELASNNIAVVTPDISELSHFDITPAITDAIEQAAAWLAVESGFAPDHRVGLMGISFSGGLSIVAAGRPSLTDRVAFVFSFGGHDDLPRVLRYLCTGTEATPRREIQLTDMRSEVTVRPPHDYGVAVILLGITDRVVPPRQVEPLRAAIRRFLWASHLDRVDKPAADREFTALRDVAARLPQPSATLLTYVNNRDVVHLGARLRPFVSSYGTDPALSPSRSPKPSAPVFLLHGTDDNVIPAIESEYLANDLRGHAPVRLLVSGLISHAEADQAPRLGDVLKLAGFWGDLLSR